MITSHTQLLNALIKKYGLKSYLEIGVQNPANNFDKIKAELKIGVDPEVVSDRVYNFGSDVFFKSWFQLHGPSEMEYKIDGDKFDLVFIDGLHHADQVKRDFENSLRCLSDNGFIVIHDVLPDNEPGTIVPRETKQWWGDVYKWAMNIRQYDGIDFKTFNIDNGCCLAWKDKEKVGGFEHKDIDWDYYQRCGYKLMNVTSTVEI